MRTINYVATRISTSTSQAATIPSSLFHGNVRTGSMSEVDLTLDSNFQDVIPAANEKEYVIRGTKRFERRLSTVKSRQNNIPNPEVAVPSEIPPSFFTRLLCGKGIGSHKPSDPNAIAPDENFHADCFVQLTKGRTAYRFIEPSSVSDEMADEIPVIVCLHGLTNCSYMWGDIVDLLSESEQGPQARILVFDFYGRGRSPWNGVPITLDVLVTQTKELLDFLGLITTSKVSIIGYDMGGAVATGFAAKFPTLCASLVLIDPVGVKYNKLKHENMLQKKYIGEYMILNGKTSLISAQEKEFFDISPNSSHRKLIDLQTSMVHWQMDNTPGYLGAILSTYRLFPLRGMDELFTAVGRHPRPVMIVWGDKDEVCPYKKSVRKMEVSFPYSCIVDVKDCGHNSIFEKFDEVVTELLSFHKELFTDESDEFDLEL